ncbi:uncharacterized protein LOC119461057 [Dermacentor silvarum]|uniref:uncharacterized protein LOC119461057 n=1 Tax=Dermacentor silvarum TaxID=543639 RepID=UPI00189ABDB2|nr:uncharacterized protein LOC119461057 [Dermacentor silvarum]
MAHTQPLRRQPSNRHQLLPPLQPQQPAPLKMYSRRVTLTLLCLTLVVALVTQEAQASKLKKVAKYALIGAALAPRIVPIPIPIGHHAHYEPHYDHGWHAGLQGGHGWW